MTIELDQRRHGRLTHLPIHVTSWGREHTKCSSFVDCECTKVESSMSHAPVHCCPPVIYISSVLMCLVLSSSLQIWKQSLSLNLLYKNATGIHWNHTCSHSGGVDSVNDTTMRWNVDTCNTSRYMYMTVNTYRLMARVKTMSISSLTRHSLWVKAFAQRSTTNYTTNGKTVHQLNKQLWLLDKWWCLGSHCWS